MEEEQPPPLTAASVAADHFRKELKLHEGSTSVVNTIVLLHDACYGHRFSRPKTSKSTLSMIVERPERIHAGVLGITTAYVRLGGRHAEGQSAPHPHKEPNPRLPFKIRRTARALPVTSPIVTNVHGTAWMGELKTMCDAAGQKLSTTTKELVRPDTGARGAGSQKAKLHEGDLYLCPESLDAFQGALGGVCDGIDAVFEGVNTGQGPSTAFVCIRPPGHHCSADFPSGFCWLNNVHVGIEYATQMHGLTHAAIIDFDLHHGDGSQAITWKHNAKVARMPPKTPASKKTSIGYFSIHDINSYPCEDGDDEKVQNASLCIENAHGQSIWNVHLQPWKTEADFWQLYESRYNVLLEKARAFLRAHTQRLRSAPNLPQPKAAIFLSAGFDASEWESQGMQRHKVNVPTEFYARLTADVVNLSKEEGLAVDGRIISVLEGGYSDRALTSGVLSHLAGLCHGQIQEDEQRKQNGLALDMGRRMASVALEAIDVKMEDEEDDSKAKSQIEYTYKRDWWHATCLSELEALSNPTLPVQPKKPTRPSVPPTYSSPTQSFTAKVVDPSKIRSSSGRFYSTSPSRAPTPPPPDVDWATAAFELHKLLIPTDRETKSCRPEQLSEPRAKKERQSTVGVPAQPPAPAAGGRQLRDRKARATAYADPQSDNESVTSRRSVSQSDRRKTIADLPLMSTEENNAPRGRRSSIASNVSGVSSVIPSVAAVRKPAVPKTTNGGVQVKKSRGKPENATAAAPPVPRVPSAFAASKAKPTATTTGAEGKVSSKEPSTEDGVSAVTAGLQRIKIKVPTEEERAAKDAKKMADEAEKKKAASTTKAGAKKAPALRTTKAPAAKKVTAASKSAVAPSVPTNATLLITANVTDVPLVAPQPEVAIATAPLQEQLEPSTTGSAEAPTPPEQQASISAASFPSTSPPVIPPPIVKIASPGRVYPSPPHESEIIPSLPMPSGGFSTVPLPTISPPKPDTPPQPPPHIIPANFNKPSSVQVQNEFIAWQPSGTTSENAAKPTSQPQQLQWLPPNSDPALRGTGSSNVSPVQVPVNALVIAPSPHEPPDSLSSASPVQPLNSQNPTGITGPAPPGQTNPAVMMCPNSRGQNMPVFTSSSPIPFASAGQPNANVTESTENDKATINHSAANGTLEPKKDVDIWDVPDTPLK